MELKSLLSRLFDWIRGAQSELTCLKKVPDFATEFSSLESRLEVSCRDALLHMKFTLLSHLGLYIIHVHERSY